MNPPFYRREDLHSGDLPPVAVALGVFDGVHRGHQALLQEVIKAAELSGAVPAVLTFDPHPTVAFAPSRVPPMLGTLKERVSLLKQSGAEIVVVAHFDQALASQTPDEFAQRILAETLGARDVIVGDDFRFGRNRAGDVTLLHKAGELLGFTVHSVAPVMIDGIPALHGDSAVNRRRQGRDGSVAAWPLLLALWQRCSREKTGADSGLPNCEP
jgi:riboflavin kinase/FMN adenylyltransferase